MIKEACVETFQEAINAEKRGANRIELCSDLASDGLTPAFDIMQKTCSALKIPVMVMIRPRAGGFVYSKAEIQQMKREIDRAKNAGAAGVVFGLLTPDNKIDETNTRKLTEYAQPLEVTFHKAIDVLDNPVEGIKMIKNIAGINRVLTSGGKPTAKEGILLLKEMIKAAGDDLVIVVAGKVTQHNIVEIQQLTGTTEFHGRKIMGNL